MSHQSNATCLENYTAWTDNKVQWPNDNHGPMSPILARHSAMFGSISSCVMSPAGTEATTQKYKSQKQTHDQWFAVGQSSQTVVQQQSNVVEKSPGVGLDVSAIAGQ